jgi:uncharacterized protein (TIGR03067 family)
MRTAALDLFGVVIALVGFAGGPVAAAPVPKHLMKEPENPDLAALQGKWKLTRIGFGGMDLTGDVLDQIDMSLEVRGDTLVMTAAKQNLRSTTTVKLDANSKPRRITFADSKATDLEGKPVNNPGAEKMGIAIYKVEGDTFVFAAKTDGKAGIPEDFGGGPNTDTAVMTFTRVKK